LGRTGKDENTDIMLYFERGREYITYTRFHERRLMNFGSVEIFLVVKRVEFPEAPLPLLLSVA
jgi:hypothetical protein